MRVVVLTLLLTSTAAFAKPWNGIDPGQTKRSVVIERFGQPTKVVKSDGKEILAYMGPNAIRGTTQAQFKVDPKTQVVERIDVFPGPELDKETIENSYGRSCPPNAPLPQSPCYLKKVTDDFRVYFHYPRLGLAIFFNPDGKTVNSFIFQPEKQPPQEAKR